MGEDVSDMHRFSARSEHGNTLPELLVVLALIAAMASIAVPLLLTYLPSATVNYSARDLQSVLNRAKLMAVTTRQPVCAQPTATRYRFLQNTTLAELLITIAILGLVMAAVLGVQLTSSTMFLRGENQADAQQAARAALLMEEDLRMVRYGCPDLGCPTPPPAGAQQAISVASTTSITFWADTLNASTTLSAAVAAGAGALPVVDASGVNVNDRIYLNNGGTWETRVVTAKAGNTLTVAALTNAYPQGTQVGRPRQIVYTF